MVLLFDSMWGSIASYLDWHHPIVWYTGELIIFSTSIMNNHWKHGVLRSGESAHLSSLHPGLSPAGINVIWEQIHLLVLSYTSRFFSPGSSVFLPPQKINFCYDVITVFLFCRMYSCSLVHHQFYNRLVSIPATCGYKQYCTTNSTSEEVAWN